MADRERSVDILLKILNDESASASTVASLDRIGGKFDDLKAKAAALKEQNADLAKSEQEYANLQIAALDKVLQAELRHLQQGQMSIDQLKQEFEWRERTAQGVNEYVDALQEASKTPVPLDPVIELGNDWGRADEQLQQYMADIREAAQLQKDMNDPFGAMGQGGGGGEEDGGGGSIGGAFGVGHALSVAGHATGSPALREAGAAIYIEEGARQTAKLFGELNDSLLKSGGLVPPLTEAFVALGVPMAGLAATVLPLALVVADIVLGIIAFTNATSDLAKAEKAHYEQTLQLTEQLQADKKQARTGSSVQAYQDTADVVGDRQSYINLLNEKRAARASTDQQYADLGSSVNPVERERLRRLGNQQDDEITELLNKIDKLNQQYQNQTLTLNPLIEQHEKEREQMQGYRDAIENNIQQESKYAADAKMTSKAAEEKVALLRQEAENQQRAADAYKQLNSTLDEHSEEYKKNAEAIKQHELAAANDRNEIDQLTNVIIPLTKATEEARDSVKNFFEELKKHAEAIGKDIGKIGDAISSFHKGEDKLTADLANQTATAKQREKQAEEQYTRGSIQDIYERNRIATEEDRKELDIRQQTFDQILDLEIKETQKESDVIQNYHRQIQDDETKYNDGLAKLQRHAQDQAADDFKEHEKKLADLKKGSNADETEALLDRNFKKLYTDGLHRSEEAQKEVNTYQDKEGKLKDHLGREVRDLQISLQQQERDQNIAEVRKLDDLRQAEQREVQLVNLHEQQKITAAERAERQKLEDLTKSETYKIQLLRKGLGDEMILYQQQEKAKLALLAHTRDLIIQEAGSHALNSGALSTAGTVAGIVKGGATLGSALLKSLHLLDSGGSFGAGEAFLKGNINETLKINGQMINYPGAAMVFPLAGGTATPHGGGNVTIAPGAIVIQDSHNPQATASAVLDILEKIMRR